MSSPSPAPESSYSRKRPRTESTSEDRKEARAHRNRIAAQNSRDRRKAQFSFLEQRVAELESENMRLRAGLGVPLVQQTQPQPVDKENEELKERIRTLEKGWDAVVKALAAQGLPLPSQQSTSQELQTQSSQPPQSTTSDSTNTMTFPLSPAPSNDSLDSLSLSPAQSSHHSLYSESDMSSTDPSSLSNQDSTRHLAAGGFSGTNSPLDGPLPNSFESDYSLITDPLMENLFDILLPESSSFSLESTTLQDGNSSYSEEETSTDQEMSTLLFGDEMSLTQTSSLFNPTNSMTEETTELDSEELQRLLEQYCSVPPSATAACGDSTGTSAPWTDGIPVGVF